MLINIRTTLATNQQGAQWLLIIVVGSSDSSGGDSAELTAYSALVSNSP